MIRSIDRLWESQHLGIVLVQGARDAQSDVLVGR